MNKNYIHLDIPEISTGFLKESNVIIGGYNIKSVNDVIEVTLLTMRLAQRIGIKSPQNLAGKNSILPYSEDSDNIIFECPVNSWLVNRQINFMRGWKQFESCIKGFNALGLMAEQVAMELKRIEDGTDERLNQLAIEFLLSRRTNGAPVFSKDEALNISKENLK